MGRQNSQLFTFCLFLIAAMLPFLKADWTTGKNSNSKISGNNNQGRIEDNSNMLLNSENSQVYITGNSNCMINLENTKGKIIDNSNCIVDWSDSNVNIESNSNLKVSNKGGEMPKYRGLCEFVRNSNFHFTGTGQVDCRFEENSNADVSMMHGGKVAAKDNSNLKIEGNSQNLIISGVTNHKITSVNENQGNRFEIVNQEQSWLGSTLGRHNLVAPGNLRYELDYFGKASIDRENYSVACFNWKMTRKGDEIQIAVNSGYWFSNLELKQVKPNSVLISCMENGKQRELRINGPYTTTVKQPENIIRIPVAFQSEL